MDVEDHAAPKQFRKERRDNEEVRRRVDVDDIERFAPMNLQDFQR
jgi:hypothetical protein